MKKNVFLFMITIILSFGLHSCSEDNMDRESKTARIQLKLVDAPGDYQEVNIEIIDIQYQSSESGNDWVSLKPESGYSINVDLTELVAGNDLLLSDEILPSGMLNQIRLILSDNNTVVVEGKPDPIHLDTPSAQQSGLKLKLNTELEAGYSYTFILDWDVQKSIVKAGNSGKYILKPVIRVNAEMNSGSIKGKVVAEATEGDHIDGVVPLNDVIVSVFSKEGIYVTETRTNENGDFIIKGINAGEYLIKIEENEYINYESPEFFNVVIGETTDLGTIELKVPVS